MVNVYLAGTFRLEKDMETMKEMKSFLQENGHTVWLAPTFFGGIRYHLLNGNELKKTIEVEKDIIKKSDVLVAVVSKATPGTMMEILFAYENGLPVITLLLSDDVNLIQNPWLTYHSKIVKSMESVLKEIKNLITK